MPSASCEARYEADELESAHVAPVPLAPTSPAYACSDAPDASSECTMSARMSMLDLCADVDAKACIYARSLSPAAVEALELSPVSLVDMLSRTHTRHASREPELEIEIEIEIEVKHPENQVSVPIQTQTQIQKQIQIQTPNRIQNQTQNQPDGRVSGQKDAQRHDRQCDLSTSVQVQACMPTLTSMRCETSATVDVNAHLNSSSTSIANSTHSSTHIHPATAFTLCLATDLNAAPALAPAPAAVAATPKRTPFHDVEAVRAAARIVSGTDHAFEGEIYAIPSTPSERERDVERSTAQADVRPRGQCVRGVARWKIDRYQLKAGERSGPFRERLVVQISLNATTTVIMGIDARNFIDREAETSVRRVQVDEPTELCLGTVNVSASLVAHEFVSYVRHLDSAICMRATTSRSWLIYYMPPLLFEHFVQAAHALHHTSVKLGALRLRMRATTEAEDRETRRRSIACCDEYRTTFAWPAAHAAPPRPAPHPHQAL